MSGGAKRGGYTIVEIMIVITITGVLFLIAYTTISGKQAQTQFTEAVRDFHSSTIDLMNDVADGYYPNTQARCTLTGARGSRVHFTSGVGAVGTNIDCIFIGKVLQFNQASSAFNVISVVGTRVNDQGAENTTIIGAQPVAAVDETTTPPTDLTERRSIKNGLIVTDIITTDGSDNRPGAVGFFTSFPKYNSSNISGALGTDIIGLRGTDITDSLILNPAAGNTAVTQIGNLTTPGYALNPTIAICLEQDGIGSNGKRAAVVIGNRGRGNTSELHIADHVSAVDMIDGVSNGSPTCNF